MDITKNNIVISGKYQSPNGSMLYLEPYLVPEGLLTSLSMIQNREIRIQGCPRNQTDDHDTKSNKEQYINMFCFS